MQFQQAVEATRLSSHGHDIVALSNALDKQRDLAARHGMTITNWDFHVYNALLGTPEKPTANIPEDVRLEIQQSRSRWMRGIPGNSGNDAMRTAIVMYNNMVAMTTTTGNAWTDAVKGKSDKLMALTSKVESLSTKLKTATTGGGGFNSGGGGGGKPKSKPTGGKPKSSAPTGSKFSIEPWRTEYAGKTKTVDGVKYNWCDKHTGRNNEYSGMYMNAETHSTHEAWLERKAQYRRDKKDKQSSWSSGGGGGSSKTSTPGKPQISQKLKTAMMAKGISGDQASAVIAEFANQQEN